MKEIRVYECQNCGKVTTIEIDLNRATNPDFSRQIADNIYDPCRCGGEVEVSILKGVKKL